MAMVERDRSDNERKTVSVAQFPKYPHDVERNNNAILDRMKTLSSEERHLARRFERLQNGGPVDVVLDIIG